MILKNELDQQIIKTILNQQKARTYVDKKWVVFAALKNGKDTVIHQFLEDDHFQDDKGKTHNLDSVIYLFSYEWFCEGLRRSDHN